MEPLLTHSDMYMKEIPYTKKGETKQRSLSVPLVEIPAGTLLFRGIQLPNPKKDEDPRMFVKDWLGYPKGDRFCLTPTHNTFFYTSPYVPFGAHTVGEWFNAIMVYQTVKNVRVVSMIGPSKWGRGGDEIKSLDGTAPIQRCDKFDYTCLDNASSAEAKREKELKQWDNCIHPDFASSEKVSGWVAIADYDSLDMFKEGKKGKETTMGKFIIELENTLPGKGKELLTSTYSDSSNHRGFPEIVLHPWSPHPGKENEYTEARTEEDAADAIAEMSDRFNYLPIACITERGILEAFSGDFKAGDLPAYATSTPPGAITRKSVDTYLAAYMDKLMTQGMTIPGLPPSKVLFDARTGFYISDLFLNRIDYAPNVSPQHYREHCFPLETPEERERVTEYKIKYRTYVKEQSKKPNTYIDGTPLAHRVFIFERPDRLYDQYKELGIKFPSTFVPYIESATKRFQEDMYLRRLKDDPRGAAEAKRLAQNANAKIQASLQMIAQAKADRAAGKKGKSMKVNTLTRKQEAIPATTQTRKIASTALPEGWFMNTTGAGERFYYSIDGQTQSEFPTKPVAVREPARQPALPNATSFTQSVTLGTNIPYLEPKNYEVIDVPSDGWCFYFALLGAVGPAPTYPLKTLADFSYNYAMGEYKYSPPSRDEIKPFVTQIKNYLLTQSADFKTFEYAYNAIQGGPGSYKAYINRLDGLDESGENRVWADPDYGIGEAASYILNANIIIYKLYKDGTHYIRTGGFNAKNVRGRDIKILFVNEDHYRIIMDKPSVSSGPTTPYMPPAAPTTPYMPPVAPTTPYMPPAAPTTPYMPPASPTYGAAPAYGTTPPMFAATTPPMFAATTPPMFAATTPPMFAATTPDYGAITQPTRMAALTGDQVTIPIVKTMDEALAIGMETLKQPRLEEYISRDTGIRTDYARPFEMNEDALKTTLKYIYDKLHHTCYMLCVIDFKPYIFKLEGGGINPRLKSILEAEIEEKGIRDINVDKTRIMQCIVKPYKDDSTVASEWLELTKEMTNQGYKFPNGIYILNLTDAMILREDLNEPWHWFTKGLVKLEKEYKNKYFLPIVSYSGNTEYDDVPIPNFDDLFKVVRNADGTVNDEATMGGKPILDWNQKIDRAVFRGSTTGCGYTPETNQRLKLTSYQFNSTLEMADMLDVGITSVTKQYKMDPKYGLGKVDASEINIQPPLTYAEQSKYQYIIHIDGNVYSYRLLTTMLSASCILRVQSPYIGWADSALRGFRVDVDPISMVGQCDYIVIKDDLSNLDNVLEWSQDHEKECKIIGANGRSKALRLLSKDYIYSSLINIFNTTKKITLSGGGAIQQKKTRKAKKSGRKTRKQKKSKEEKLVLATYRGGSIDSGMEEYVQKTMRNVWTSFLAKIE